MSKAILEFDLNDADDKYSFEVASNGHKLHSSVEEFWNTVLRQYYKYGIPENIKTTDEFLENIRERFLSILTDNDVSKYI